jgi:hypothetical protein
VEEGLWWKISNTIRLRKGQIKRDKGERGKRRKSKDPSRAPDRERG